MMVEAMQRAFKQNLEFIDWMSPQSAEAARAKLEHMVDLIGYPAFVLNNTWLDQGKKIVLHPHDTLHTFHINFDFSLQRPGHSGWYLPHERCKPPKIRSKNGASRLLRDSNKRDLE